MFGRETIKDSEEDFKEMSSAGPKWKLIIAYYACYDAFYSLLMKCGIKSEIHECSLELMELFSFSDEEIKYIQGLKKAREGNQYYLKRNLLYYEDKVRKFINRCKEISLDLNDDKINEIRKFIK